LINSVFAILGSALSIWEHHEKTKYVDRYVSLKRDYYEAINRPPETWNDARLDNIRFELQLLVDSVSTEIGSGKSLENKP
jgi:hypothetical protein